MASTIQHNTQDQEFILEENGHHGELAYSRPTDGVLDFTHTYMSKALRGQGLADKLAEAALTYAREQHLKVQASCEFMESYLQRHPEHQDLLA